MKLLTDIGKAAKAARIKLAGGVLAPQDIAKRDGLYVSRPLLPQNAKKWHDWAVKHGIPDPVPAEEMHVTVLYSTVDVKLPMDELPITIGAGQEWWDNALSFAMFGPNDESLVCTFHHWPLYHRNQQFLAAGAKSTWPDYRPHLTLSNNAAGFELTDEALADVPRYILLGPEVNDALRRPDASELNQDGTGEEGDDVYVIVIDIARAEAKAILDKEDDVEKTLTPMDAYALADVAAGRVSRGVAKRLAATDWAPQSIKDLAKAENKPATTLIRKRQEADMTVQVSAVPKELAKKLHGSEIAKTNDEEQIVMGIASVSTIDGQLVTDLHDEQITTQGLREFNKSIISGTRAGKFDHEGDVKTEIVAGLVLSNDWQKSLGIDLGFEPYLVEIHVPDAQDWAEVKKGDWMLSIAGKMWYYEDVEADA